MHNIECMFSRLDVTISQRTFIRTMPHSGKDTFQELRRWLKERYGDALPPPEDIEEVVFQDEQFDYCPNPLPSGIPLPSDCATPAPQTEN